MKYFLIFENNYIKIKFNYDNDQCIFKIFVNSKSTQIMINYSHAMLPTQIALVKSYPHLYLLFATSKCEDKNYCLKVKGVECMLCHNILK